MLSVEPVCQMTQEEKTVNRFLVPEIIFIKTLELPPCTFLTSFLWLIIA